MLLVGSRGAVFSSISAGLVPQISIVMNWFSYAPFLNRDGCLCKAWAPCSISSSSWRPRVVMPRPTILIFFRLICTRFFDRLKYLGLALCSYCAGDRKEHDPEPIRLVTSFLSKALDQAHTSGMGDEAKALALRSGQSRRPRRPGRPSARLGSDQLLPRAPCKKIVEGIHRFAAGGSDHGE